MVVACSSSESASCRRPVEDSDRADIAATDGEAACVTDRQYRLACRGKTIHDPLNGYCSNGTNTMASASR